MQFWEVGIIRFLPLRKKQLLAPVSKKSSWGSQKCHATLLIRVLFSFSFLFSSFLFASLSPESIEPVGMHVELCWPQPDNFWPKCHPCSEPTAGIIQYTGAFEAQHLQYKKPVEPVMTPACLLYTASMSASSHQNMHLH